MPRVKESGTRWREYWSRSDSGQAVSCDECGAPDLRVAYRCRVAPVAGVFCRRNRCWRCAKATRVHRPSRLLNAVLESCAVVEEPVCKACRAEVVFTGLEKSILSL